ncbi:Signal transduction histidine kinase [Micromonospora phaseoli]|uniref:histidine kinase n=1 Tax=Micromonospora phaseoli TaxID=1144548 RepID=A0A1H7DHL3_9ACTN|nr:nitrate- and nitrite sensing domain-containing protein [Micromonospora phaseoli]PZW02337.1 signal transduction histidine kinase [Micromonospora phaseoli]GIJ75661.1 histidine kinase [Micromonospora phaseoli]SEK01289.1 Signal transduction histidine kinase [Micromonospora phaseoli]
MLLDSLRIRGKLTLLVIIPLLCMLGLTLPVVWERTGVAQRAGEIDSTVQVASRVGTLLQHLQRERMLAIGLLLGQVQRSELVQEIAEVDDRVVDLRIEFGDELPAEVAGALDGVKRLAEVRTAVQAGQARPEQVIGAYGPVHVALIDSLRLPYDVDTRTPAGKQVLALDGILRKSEGLSSGGALIVLIAASPDPQQLATAFVANMATLQADSNRMLGLLTPEQQELVNIEQTAVDARTSPEFLEQSALDPVAAVAGRPLEALFPTVSSLVTLGQFVEKKLVADVTAEVRAQRQAALTAAYWVTALVASTLLVVVLLALAIGRTVTGPLTRLTRSADRVARVAESELVRVADDETDNAQPVRLDPVDVRARDEIGDLARAFERVQNTAARLVERQAASRRNVAQMFGHVGRRTQNLVGRQIALIDRLEQQETEPGRLENLYRLDHISSRLRRNAGNLVVLSGAAGDVAHVAPVPLTDVVRLALGEIEDYTRVDLQIPTEVAAAPAIIGDLVLALAELMENATVFSPPHTRVVVGGELNEDGVQLTVVDHGIGMTEARLTDENARLTRRERLDLAPTEVLGLFVVGRLARRHGWQIALVATPGGGVTAVLRIPRSSLVVTAPEQAGLPAVAVGRAAPAATPPVRYQPEPAVVPGEGALATAGAGRSTTDSSAAPGFDHRLLSRATESIELAESWDAFATSLEAAPSTDAEPATATGFEPVSQVSTAPPAPMPGVRQRVPGASLPRTAPRVGPVDATDADPVAARTAVEEFESGVRRAEQSQAGGPEPVAPPSPAGLSRLSRRVPGANLIAALPQQPISQDPGDPAEVRDRINAFETGVARALRDVRTDRSDEEGTPR